MPLQELARRSQFWGNRFMDLSVLERVVGLPVFVVVIQPAADDETSTLGRNGYVTLVEQAMDVCSKQQALP